MEDLDISFFGSAAYDLRCKLLTHEMENSPIVASTSHVAGYHLLVSKDSSATVFGLISSTRAVFALVDKPCFKIDVLITSLNLKPL
jgi:hypothetical protein